MLMKPHSKDQMLECNPGLGSFYRGRVKVVEGPGFDSREREMSQLEFSQKFERVQTSARFSCLREHRFPIISDPLN